MATDRTSRLETQNSFQSMLLAVNTGASVYSAVQLNQIEQNSRQATDAIKERLDGINRGISDLGAQFGYLLSLQLLKARIDAAQNQQILDELASIRSVLESPDATRAQELQTRALTLLSKNLLQEAHDLLVQADALLPEEFYIKYHLGYLALYGLTESDNLIDYDAAERYFGKALRLGRAELGDSADIAPLVADSCYHAGVAVYINAIEGAGRESDDRRNELLQRALDYFGQAIHYNESAAERDRTNPYEADGANVVGDTGEDVAVGHAAHGEACFTAAEAAAWLGDMDGARNNLESAIRSDCLYLHRALNSEALTELHGPVEHWRSRIQRYLADVEEKEASIRGVVESGRPQCDEIEAAIPAIMDELYGTGIPYAERVTRLCEALSKCKTVAPARFGPFYVKAAGISGLESGKTKKVAIDASRDLGILDLAVCLEKPVKGLQEPSVHPFMALTGNPLPQIAAQIRAGQIRTFFSAAAFDWLTAALEATSPNAPGSNGYSLWKPVLEKVAITLQYEKPEGFGKEDGSVGIITEYGSLTSDLVRGISESMFNNISNNLAVNMARLAWASMETELGEAYVRASGAGAYPLKAGGGRKGLYWRDGPPEWVDEESRSRRFGDRRDADLQGCDHLDAIITWVRARRSELDEIERRVDSLSQDRSRDGLRRRKEAAVEMEERARRIAEVDLPPVLNVLRGAERGGPYDPREYVRALISEHVRVMSAHAEKEMIARIRG